jgi:hypothetical protein
LLRDHSRSWLGNECESKKRRRESFASKALHISHIILPGQLPAARGVGLGFGTVVITDRFVSFK